ncbi:MAG TPA: hypothetical protein VGL46_14985 [Pseudonocardiaceae bacterium]|jgi:hypothetical protein
MVDLRSELLTDASSWRLLTCYMDAAAWIGVPAAWPTTRVPGTDFGRVAVTALDAVAWGLPDRRDVCVAVLLNEATTWLRESQTPLDDEAMWAAARVYVQALSPVKDLPVTLDLLAHLPTERQRRAAKRERRWRPWLGPWRHQPADASEPDLLPALWWKPLWQQQMRVQQCATRPALHAAAALAAAVWSAPGALRDPISVRQELRDRVVKARAWAVSGEFPII